MKQIFIIKQYSIVLLLLIASISAYAKSFKVDNVKYKLSDDKTYVYVEDVIPLRTEYVNGGKKNILPETIFIPKQITVKDKTYPVEFIYSCAFDKVGGESTVVIEEYTYSDNDRIKREKMNSSDPTFYSFLDWYFRSYSDGNYNYSYPYNGYKVIINNLIFDDSLTEIPNRALSSYHSDDFKLTVGSVTLPNNLTKIGKSAFNKCHGLTSLTIPESVTEIGECAFYGCSDLMSLTIPNSVTSIGRAAFASCSGLYFVTIPKSVTKIEAGAFANCPNLVVNVENPNADIDRSAFEGTMTGNMQNAQRQEQYEQQRKEQEKLRSEKAINELTSLKNKIGVTTFNNLNKGVITNGMKWSSIMAFRDYINRWNYLSGAKIVDELPSEVKIGGIRVKETSSTSYGTNYAIDFTNRRGGTMSGGFIRVKNGVVTSVNLERAK